MNYYFNETRFAHWYPTKLDLWRCSTLRHRYLKMLHAKTLSWFTPYSICIVMFYFQANTNEKNNYKLWLNLILVTHLELKTFYVEERHYFKSYCKVLCFWPRMVKDDCNWIFYYVIIKRRDTYPKMTVEECSLTHEEECVENISCHWYQRCSWMKKE